MLTDRIVIKEAPVWYRNDAVNMHRPRSALLGAAALGGKGGGGRPDMAQAGGPDGAKTQEALAAVEAGLIARAG